MVKVLCKNQGFKSPGHQSQPPIRVEAFFIVFLLQNQNGFPLFLPKTCDTPPKPQRSVCQAVPECEAPPSPARRSRRKPDCLLRGSCACTGWSRLGKKNNKQTAKNAETFIFFAPFLHSRNRNQRRRMPQTFLKTDKLCLAHD